ncbi:hypothetical protein HUB98_15235 [Paenibacillus barcinonensis]|uniref:Uncharacterized protein n=1 Tax=Paenibacillus barcinonensis TaxID=198119 RepID=A0A2V4VMP6_PAEBA|nr:hypothetical protein [Paenibacillus barcinonensis]PYE50856.1 hypothetical protein DFQ00_103275 [Paenibacillus barcinonensis]QKS57527.1 hypothetical protein HUB98_15235 [Paenibacillus barcinonensis]
MLHVTEKARVDTDAQKLMYVVLASPPASFSKVHTPTSIQMQALVVEARQVHTNSLPNSNDLRKRYLAMFDAANILTIPAELI